MIFVAYELKGLIKEIALIREIAKELLEKI